MTRDAVAVCRRRPDEESVRLALMAAASELTPRPLPEFGTLALCDPHGRTMVTIDGPALVQVPGEASRLLGLDVPTRDPVWWVEIRAIEDVFDAYRLARRIAGALAALTDGWAAL